MLMLVLVLVVLVVVGVVVLTVGEMVVAVTILVSWCLVSSLLVTLRSWPWIAAADLAGSLFLKLLLHSMSLLLCVLLLVLLLELLPFVKGLLTLL
jgi:hypothetical protein